MLKTIHKNQPVTTKGLEKLLSEQARVIISATDEKFDRLEMRIAVLEEKLVASETRINNKLERLTNTLDQFLKRLTDTEDEFEIMKYDVNRIKKVIKEKLGVSLS
jgi:hypothetical protein